MKKDISEGWFYTEFQGCQCLFKQYFLFHCFVSNAKTNSSALYIIALK